MWMKENGLIRLDKNPHRCGRKPHQAKDDNCCSILTIYSVLILVSDQLLKLLPILVECALFQAIVHVGTVLLTFDQPGSP